MIKTAGDEVSKRGLTCDSRAVKRSHHDTSRDSAGRGVGKESGLMRELTVSSSIQFIASHAHFKRVQSVTAAILQNGGGGWVDGGGGGGGANRKQLQVDYTRKTKIDSWGILPNLIKSLMYVQVMTYFLVCQLSIIVSCIKRISHVANK